tara:strand:- start:40903 stop:41253 length:351 start_codon:yes stop_codon:yes gene_type:complete
MDKEKEETPIEKWRNNLKPGDLIWISHYNCLYPGVFKAFLPGKSYDGLRMHYYSLPLSSGNNSWYQKRLERWENDNTKPYVDYINARAADRVAPMSIDMLDGELKDYYKRLKQLIR